MVIADLAATADDNVLTQESSDTAFRKEQLRRLQDEVIELEDVRTGVSITDLGLNDFRMDLLGYVKEYGDLAAAPKGLHAVIPADPAKGLYPGVLFVLRNVNADESFNRGNRLHPHYLVYLDDEGNVISDHTEAKHLLDLVRAGCRPYDQPVTEVARISSMSQPARASEMEKLLRAPHRCNPVHDRGHRRARHRQPLQRRPHYRPDAVDRRSRRLRADRLHRRDRPSTGVGVTGGLYRWPEAARFGRVVPKSKFYEHATVPTAVRERFVSEVQRITWAYKLAENTVNLSGTNEVPEIQVFQIDAKGSDISESVLAAIDKAVKTPIIFEVNRGERAARHTRMIAAHKAPSIGTAKLGSYHSTEWFQHDAERQPLPTAIDLPALYARLIESLTSLTARPGETLSEIAGRVESGAKLERGDRTA